MKPQITDQQFEGIAKKMVLEYAMSAPNRVLHQMAAQWNGAHEFLEWLVNRPETDKATAVMIYWMSGPRWWKQFSDRQYLLDNDMRTSGLTLPDTYS